MLYKRKKIDSVAPVSAVEHHQYSSTKTKSLQKFKAENAAYLLYLLT